MVDHRAVEMFVAIWGEVGHRGDCYRLRSVAGVWAPRQIVDVGANVGTFTVWASILFPGVPVTSVEPDPWNYANLCQFTANLGNVTRVNKALGNGPIYRCDNGEQGGNQAYISPCLGYVESGIAGDPYFIKTDVQAVGLHELVPEPDGTLLKIDIEGMENHLLDGSYDSLLQKLPFFALETHCFAQTGAGVRLVREKTGQLIYNLGKTHDCTTEGPVTVAIRKDVPTHGD